ncbi:MAG: sulfatase-like hydrolase/transferase, partial [Victivallales bacterium]|nr:sulfatase-like hydrolase/transferase [Victivallales bacterium]
AMSADQAFFIQEDHHGNCFDQDILTYLEKCNPTGRALVIIHLYGNHYPYGISYPADFKFPTGLGTYEKSVFYNDYVLQQFMDYFQSHGATMVAYVSDHADAVSIGKGHDPRPSNFQREMIEIPMWFWVSDEYRQQYPKLFDKLQASSNKVVTNDLVFNMFMDLMQIQPTDKYDKYSPLSDNYILDTEPPKTLGGKMEILNP